MEVDRRSVLHSTADQYAEVRPLLVEIFLSPRLPRCMVCGTSLRSDFPLRIASSGLLLSFCAFSCQGPWSSRLVTRRLMKLSRKINQGRRIKT